MTGVLRSISALGQRPVQAAPAPCAVLRDVSFDFEGRPILSGINLTIQPGAAIGILGENGSGKSSLLRLLATLSRPSRGRVELFGVDTAAGAGAARGRIGLLAHNPMLYRELTALENLEFFARLHGLRQARQRAMQTLDQLGLAARARDPVASLSRGMVQRVALARAMVHAPPLLLLDEPLTGLDDTAAALVMDSLRDARDGGTTLVLTGHRDDAGLSIARELLHLCSGGLHRVPARSGASAPPRPEGGPA